jgi:predicted nucleic acid-binding protein
MTLVDTSAWIEFLRGTGSEVHTRVRAMLAGGEPIATSEVVVMEVLAGARDDAHLDRLRRLVLGLPVITLQGLVDFEDGAGIYRRCRRAGETVRSTVDCLIAAVAIRADVPLLHADRDFAAIARHSPLRLVAV